MFDYGNEFTSVPGISDIRRFPRLGKIRLGVKAISQKTEKEFPKEVDYFVVPPEVARIYGEKPKELDIMFAISDLRIIFPQAYKYYGETKGLKCIGNLKKAKRLNDEGVFEERTCPCELKDNGCALRAHLLVILPKVNVGGVYQIDIGSFNSIVAINSGLSFVESLLGHFSLVPLKLRRVPKDIAYDGQLRTHYPLEVVFDCDFSTLMKLKEGDKVAVSNKLSSLIELPPVEDINPKFDDGAVIVNVDEEENGNGNSNNIKELNDYARDVKQLFNEPIVPPSSPAAITNNIIRKDKTNDERQGMHSKPPLTEKQKQTIKRIAIKNGFDENTIDVFLSVSKLSIDEASKLIAEIMADNFTRLKKYIEDNSIFVKE